MNAHPRRIGSLPALALGLCLLAPALAAARENSPAREAQPVDVSTDAGARAPTRAVIGHLIAVSGDVSVEDRDGARRAAACGDALHEGDVLITAPAAHAALTTGDVHAQVASDTRVRVARTESGAPDVVVLQGRVRIIDTDDGEVVASRDVEKDASRSCKWGDEIEAHRQGEASDVVARSGECASAKPYLSVFRAAQEASNGAGDETASDLASVAGNASDLLSPTDVAAAGGPGFGQQVSPPRGLRPPALGPCNVGSTCLTGGGGAPPPPSAIPIMERPARPALPPGASPRLPPGLPPGA